MLPATMYLIAQAKPAPNPLFQFMVPLILMFVIFYFMLIKPQQRKQKKHQEMLKKVKSGDHVVTTGGIHGTVAAVKEHTFMLKVADKMTIEVSRSSLGVNISAEEAGADDKSKSKG